MAKLCKGIISVVLEMKRRMKTKRVRYAGRRQALLHQAHEFSQPARKKTKAEVMAEVIAKSKEHKVRFYVPICTMHTLVSVRHVY